MKRFYSLTKPGIIFGNLITCIGGFFLGSQHGFQPWVFLFTLIGIALVVASGCVFNNIIDRDIDKLMERTKNRVLVKGLMSVGTASVYGAVLGILGFLTLYFAANPLTVLVAFIGFVFYVGVYSLGFKRTSVHGTLIGGISGAVPPVVGYCAATNRFDIGAIILFLILFCWQMPHFYAIAIYRIKDYSAAEIPVLPIKRNIHYTKISSLLYIIAFTIAAVLPSFFGYENFIYFIVALAIGVLWFVMGVKGLKIKSDAQWARKMFGFSILGITLLSAVMVVR